jgi:hypothetical protein
MGVQELTEALKEFKLPRNFIWIRREENEYKRNKQNKKYRLYAFCAKGALNL